MCSRLDEETKSFPGKWKQIERSRNKVNLWKAEEREESEVMEIKKKKKSWGQVFTQARLGFWWGLFPVHPGKCGPQLSRRIRATTCSSLEANLCFLAASSCSSEHTICQGGPRGTHTLLRVLTGPRLQLMFAHQVRLQSECHVISLLYSVSDL